MSDFTKVHTGLTSVDRDTVYHFGHFEASFADGAMRFELLGRICPEPACFCDNLQLTWQAKDHDLPTWYTAKHEWRDLNHQPMPEDIVTVFRSMEATDEFRDRYQHMMFLRRRQVLQETGQLDEEIPLQIPKEALGADADVDNGILGRLNLGSRGRKYAYAMDTCSDPECYCDHLFLSLLAQPDDQVAASIMIDGGDQWSLVDDRPDQRNLLRKVRNKLKDRKAFQQIVECFRLYRTFENYARFVKEYPKQTGIRIAG